MGPARTDNGLSDNLGTTRVCWLAALCGSLALGSGAAHTADWQVDAGAGIVSASRSLGSGRQQTLPVPVIEARYRDWFFATDNPYEGIGVAKSFSTSWRLSAAIGLDLDTRDPHEDGRVRGLPKVSAAAAFRVRAEYETQRLFSSITLAQRLAGPAATGLTMAGEAGYHVVATRRVLGSFGLDVRLMDDRWAGNFLTVTDAQSAYSGLAAYRARAGLLDAGGFVQALYRIDDRWTLFARLQYTQFEDQARSSPVVSHPGNPLGLFFITRAF